MRLRRLDLDFFGHFTGRSFDFGVRPEGKPDFHIVYGPNEAGKTTTMEGFLRLLYGFDARESYAFMHERKALKVSGVLDINGVETAYTRLPTRNASLVDATGSPVPQAALDRVLAGLGQEEYRKLLCLDDDTIERGGKEIIDSKGDIGLLLFGASAGISDLSAVLAQVDKDARDLYLKGGSKSEFLMLRKELEEVNGRIKEIDVTATAYRGLRETVASAEAEEGEADAERLALHERAARLTAMAEVLPLLDTIDAERTRLAAFAHYPERLDIDPETLVTMLGEQSAYEADQARLTGEIEALRKTLDSIDRDPDRLSLAEALENLEDLKAEYRAAEKHLPNRLASQEDATRRMRRCADDLGVDGAVDLATLALSPVQFAALDAGRTRLKDARRDVAVLQDDLRDFAEQIAGGEDALKRLTDTAPEGAGIAALLDRFDRAAHDVAVQRVADAEARARDALAAISIKGHRFDTPPTASLTASEAGEIVDRLTDLTRRREEEAKRIETLEAEDARIETRKDALALRTGLVTDEIVREAMHSRETLWTAHRDALSDPTADAFEASMLAVDDMVARRLAQAEGLGELRALDTERADLAVQRKQAQAAVTRLSDDIAQTRVPLDAMLVDTAVPLTPTQGGVVTWLEHLEAAQTEARAVAEATRAAAPVLAKAEALAVDLAQMLPDARPGDGLADLLDAAQAGAEAARSHATDVDKAQATLTTLRDTSARRTRKLTEAEAAVAEAEAAWTALVTEHCGTAIAPETLLASLDPLRDLRTANDERLDLADRIEKMQAEQSRFQEAVAVLAGGAADDPLDTFAALGSDATLARKAEDRWLEATEQLDAKLSELEAAENALSGIATKIAHLGAAFDPTIQTDTLDALREAVGTAHGVIADRKTLAEHERTVRTRLDVADIAEARDVLGDSNADRIAAERAALDTDIGLADARYRTAIEAHANAKTALRAVTGDADVAHLVERRKTLELQMQEVALDYLELRLGNSLAEEAIRRYRDANRSAMLTATETAFAELTNGAYTRLTTLPDGQSETLLAIDAAGMSKAADGMSKGTRFQLFLALRAAAYEQMAATGAVLPFFCDDIFETFDEDRTRAACTLMARIGRMGQAIYLTHHRHVVDIARDVCGEDLTVHQI